jgi:hypothetical protein
MTAAAMGCADADVSAPVAVVEAGRCGLLRLAVPVDRDHDRTHRCCGSITGSTYPATALQDGPWIVGPVLLLILISGTALAATTRIAAGTGQRLSAALLGDVLAAQQVDRIGLHVRAVTGWGGCFVRKPGAGHRPAQASAAQGTMFGHDHGRVRDVEHLPRHFTHSRRVVQTSTTTPATWRFVHDHQVRIRPGFQRRTGRARLFALPAFCSVVEFAAIRDRTLVPCGPIIGRRRPRRVRRITLHEAFQPRDLLDQQRDERFEFHDP